MLRILHKTRGKPIGAGLCQVWALRFGNKTDLVASLPFSREGCSNILAEVLNNIRIGWRRSYRLETDRGEFSRLESRKLNVFRPIRDYSIA